MLNGYGDSNIPPNANGNYKHSQVSPTSGPKPSIPMYPSAVGGSWQTNEDLYRYYEEFHNHQQQSNLHPHQHSQSHQHQRVDMVSKSAGERCRNTCCQPPCAEQRYSLNTPLPPHSTLRFPSRSQYPLSIPSGYMESPFSKKEVPFEDFIPKLSPTGTGLPQHQQYSHKSAMKMSPQYPSYPVPREPMRVHPPPPYYMSPPDVTKSNMYNSLYNNSRALRNINDRRKWETCSYNEYPRQVPYPTNNSISSSGQFNPSHLYPPYSPSFPLQPPSSVLNGSNYSMNAPMSGYGCNYTVPPAPPLPPATISAGPVNKKPLDKKLDIDVREYLATWDDDADDESSVKPPEPEPIVVLDCTALEGDGLAQVREKLKGRSVQVLQSNQGHSKLPYDLGSATIVHLQNSDIITKDSSKPQKALDFTKAITETSTKSTGKKAEFEALVSYYGETKKDDTSYDFVEMTERLVGASEKFCRPDKDSNEKIPEARMSEVQKSPMNLMEDPEQYILPSIIHKSVFKPESVVHLNSTPDHSAKERCLPDLDSKKEVTPNISSTPCGPDKSERADSCSKTPIPLSSPTTTVTLTHLSSKPFVHPDFSVSSSITPMSAMHNTKPQTSASYCPSTLPSTHHSNAPTMPSLSNNRSSNISDVTRTDRGNFSTQPLMTSNYSTKFTMSSEYNRKGVMSSDYPPRPYMSTDYSNNPFLSSSYPPKPIVSSFPNMHSMGSKYPSRPSISSEYASKLESLTDYSTRNALLSGGYPTKPPLPYGCDSKLMAAGYPNRHPLSSEMNTKSSTSSDSRSMIASDHYVRHNMPSDYSDRPSMFTNYPSNPMLSSSHAAKPGVISGYPSAPLISPDYSTKLMTANFVKKPQVSPADNRSAMSSNDSVRPAVTSECTQNPIDSSIQISKSILQLDSSTTPLLSPDVSRSKSIISEFLPKPSLPADHVATTSVMSDFTAKPTVPIDSCPCPAKMSDSTIKPFTDLKYSQIPTEASEHTTKKPSIPSPKVSTIGAMSEYKTRETPPLGHTLKAVQGDDASKTVALSGLNTENRISSDDITKPTILSNIVKSTNSAIPPDPSIKSSLSDGTVVTSIEITKPSVVVNDSCKLNVSSDFCGKSVDSTEYCNSKPVDTTDFCNRTVGQEVDTSQYFKKRKWYHSYCNDNQETPITSNTQYNEPNYFFEKRFDPSCPPTVPCLWDTASEEVKSMQTKSCDLNLIPGNFSPNRPNYPQVGDDLKSLTKDCLMEQTKILTQNVQISPIKGNPLMSSSVSYAQIVENGILKNAPVEDNNLVSEDKRTTICDSDYNICRNPVTKVEEIKNENKNSFDPLLSSSRRSSYNTDELEGNEKESVLEDCPSDGTPVDYISNELAKEEDDLSIFCENSFEREINDFKDTSDLVSGKPIMKFDSNAEMILCKVSYSNKLKKIKESKKISQEKKERINRMRGFRKKKPEELGKDEENKVAEKNKIVEEIRKPIKITVQKTQVQVKSKENNKIKYKTQFKLKNSKDTYENEKKETPDAKKRQQEIKLRASTKDSKKFVKILKLVKKSVREETTCEKLRKCKFKLMKTNVNESHVLENNPTKAHIYDFHASDEEKSTQLIKAVEIPPSEINLELNRERKENTYETKASQMLNIELDEICDSSKLASSAEHLLSIKSEIVSVSSICTSMSSDDSHSNTFLPNEKLFHSIHEVNEVVETVSPLKDHPSHKNEGNSLNSETLFDSSILLKDTECSLKLEESQKLSKNFLEVEENLRRLHGECSVQNASISSKESHSWSSSKSNNFERTDFKNVNTLFCKPIQKPGFNCPMKTEDSSFAAQKLTEKNSLSTNCLLENSSDEKHIQHDMHGTPEVAEESLMFHEDRRDLSMPNVYHTNISNSFCEGSKDTSLLNFNGTNETPFLNTDSNLDNNSNALHSPEQIGISSSDNMQYSMCDATSDLIKPKVQELFGSQDVFTASKKHIINCKVTNNSKLDVLESKSEHTTLTSKFMNIQSKIMEIKREFFKSKPMDRDESSNDTFLKVDEKEFENTEENSSSSVQLKQNDILESQSSLCSSRSTDCFEIFDGTDKSSEHYLDYFVSDCSDSEERTIVSCHLSKEIEGRRNSFDPTSLLNPSVSSSSRDFESIKKDTLSASDPSDINNTTEDTAKETSLFLNSCLYKESQKINPDSSPQNSKNILQTQLNHSSGEPDLSTHDKFSEPIERSRKISCADISSIPDLKPKYLLDIDGRESTYGSQETFTSDNTSTKCIDTSDTKYFEDKVRGDETNGDTGPMIDVDNKGLITTDSQTPNNSSDKLNVHGQFDKSHSKSEDNMSTTFPETLENFTESMQNLQIHTLYLPVEKSTTKRSREIISDDHSQDKLEPNNLLLTTVKSPPKNSCLEKELEGDLYEKTIDNVDGTINNVEKTSNGSCSSNSASSLSNCDTISNTSQRSERKESQNVHYDDDNSGSHGKDLILNSVSNIKKTSSQVHAPETNLQSAGTSKKSKSKIESNLQTESNSKEMLHDICTTAMGVNVREKLLNEPIAELKGTLPNVSKSCECLKPFKEDENNIAESGVNNTVNETEGELIRPKSITLLNPSDEANDKNNTTNVKSSRKAPKTQTSSFKTEENIPSITTYVKSNSGNNAANFSNETLEERTSQKTSSALYIKDSKPYTDSNDVLQNIVKSTLKITSKPIKPQRSKGTDPAANKFANLETCSKSKTNRELSEVKHQKATDFIENSPGSECHTESKETVHVSNSCKLMKNNVVEESKHKKKSSVRVQPPKKDIPIVNKIDLKEESSSRSSAKSITGEIIEGVRHKTFIIRRVEDQRNKKDKINVNNVKSSSTSNVVSTNVTDTSNKITTAVNVYDYICVNLEKERENIDFDSNDIDASLQKGSKKPIITVYRYNKEFEENNILMNHKPMSNSSPCGKSTDKTLACKLSDEIRNIKPTDVLLESRNHDVLDSTVSTVPWKDKKVHTYGRHISQKKNNTSNISATNRVSSDELSNAPIAEETVASSIDYVSEQEYDCNKSPDFSNQPQSDSSFGENYATDEMEASKALDKIMSIQRSFKALSKKRLEKKVKGEHSLSDENSINALSKTIHVPSDERPSNNKSNEVSDDASKLKTPHFEMMKSAIINDFNNAQENETYLNVTHDNKTDQCSLLKNVFDVEKMKTVNEDDNSALPKIISSQEEVQTRAIVEQTTSTICTNNSIEENVTKLPHQTNENKVYSDVSLDLNIINEKVVTDNCSEHSFNTVEEIMEGVNDKILPIEISKSPKIISSSDVQEKSSHTEFDNSLDTSSVQVTTESGTIIAKLCDQKQGIMDNLHDKTLKDGTENIKIFKVLKDNNECVYNKSTIASQDDDNEGSVPNKAIETLENDKNIQYAKAADIEAHALLNIFEVSSTVTSTEKHVSKNDSEDSIDNRDSAREIEDDIIRTISDIVNESESKSSLGNISDEVYETIIEVVETISTVVANEFISVESEQKHLENLSSRELLIEPAATTLNNEKTSAFLEIIPDNNASIEATDLRSEDLHHLKNNNSRDSAHEQTLSGSKIVNNNSETIIDTEDVLRTPKNEINDEHALKAQAFESVVGVIMRTHCNDTEKEFGLDNFTSEVQDAKSVKETFKEDSLVNVDKAHFQNISHYTEPNKCTLDVVSDVTISTNCCEIPLPPQSLLQLPCQESMQPPLPCQEKNQPLLPYQVKNQPPLPCQEKNQPPLPCQEKTQPPLPSHEKNQPPLPSHKKNQPPLPSHEKNQPPLPSHEKNQPPLPSHEKNQPPLPSHEKIKPPLPCQEMYLPPPPLPSPSLLASIEMYASVESNVDSNTFLNCKQSSKLVSVKPGSEKLDDLPKKTLKDSNKRKQILRMKSMLRFENLKRQFVSKPSSVSDPKALMNTKKMKTQQTYSKPNIDTVKNVNNIEASTMPLFPLKLEPFTQNTSLKPETLHFNESELLAKNLKVATIDSANFNSENTNISNANSDNSKVANLTSSHYEECDSATLKRKHSDSSKNSEKVQDVNRIRDIPRDEDTSKSEHGQSSKKTISEHLTDHRNEKAHPSSKSDYVGKQNWDKCSSSSNNENKTKVINNDKSIKNAEKNELHDRQKEQSHGESENDNFKEFKRNTIEQSTVLSDLNVSTDTISADNVSSQNSFGSEDLSFEDVFDSQDFVVIDSWSDSEEAVAEHTKEELFQTCEKGGNAIIAKVTEHSDSLVETSSIPNNHLSKEVNFGNGTSEKNEYPSFSNVEKNHNDKSRVDSKMVSLPNDQSDLKKNKEAKKHDFDDQHERIFTPNNNFANISPQCLEKSSTNILTDSSFSKDNYTKSESISSGQGNDIKTKVEMCVLFLEAERKSCSKNQLDTPDTSTLAGKSLQSIDSNCVVNNKMRKPDITGVLKLEQNQFNKKIIFDSQIKIYKDNVQTDEINVKTNVQKEQDQAVFCQNESAISNNIILSKEITDGTIVSNQMNLNDSGEMQTKCNDENSNANIQAIGNIQKYKLNKRTTSGSLQISPLAHTDEECNKGSEKLSQDTDHQMLLVETIETQPSVLTVDNAGDITNERTDEVITKLEEKSLNHMKVNLKMPIQRSLLTNEPESEDQSTNTTEISTSDTTKEFIEGTLEDIPPKEIQPKEGIKSVLTDNDTTSENTVNLDKITSSEYNHQTADKTIGKTVKACFEDNQEPASHSKEPLVVESTDKLSEDGVKTEPQKKSKKTRIRISDRKSSTERKGCLSARNERRLSKRGTGISKADAEIIAAKKDLTYGLRERKPAVSESSSMETLESRRTSLRINSILKKKYEEQWEDTLLASERKRKQDSGLTNKCKKFKPEVEIVSSTSDVSSSKSRDDVSSSSELVKDGIASKMCTVITNGGTIYIKLKSQSEDIAIVDTDCYVLINNDPLSLLEQETPVVIVDGTNEDIRIENSSVESYPTDARSNETESPPTLKPFWNENNLRKEKAHPIPVLKAEESSKSDERELDNSMRTLQQSTKKKQSGDVCLVQSNASLSYKDRELPDLSKEISEKSKAKLLSTSEPVECNTQNDVNQTWSDTVTNVESCAAVDLGQNLIPSIDERSNSITLSTNTPQKEIDYRHDLENDFKENCLLPLGKHHGFPCGKSHPVISYKESTTESKTSVKKCLRRLTNKRKLLKSFDEDENMNKVRKPEPSNEPDNVEKISFDPLKKYAEINAPKNMTKSSLQDEHCSKSSVHKKPRFHLTSSSKSSYTENLDHKDSNKKVLIRNTKKTVTCEENVLKPNESTSAKSKHLHIQNKPLLASSKASKEKINENKKNFKSISSLKRKLIEFDANLSLFKSDDKDLKSIKRITKNPESTSRAETSSTKSKSDVKGPVSKQFKETVLSQDKSEPNNQTVEDEEDDTEKILEELVTATLKPLITPLLCTRIESPDNHDINLRGNRGSLSPTKKLKFFKDINSKVLDNSILTPFVSCKDTNTKTDRENNSLYSLNSTHTKNGSLENEAAQLLHENYHENFGTPGKDSRVSIDANTSHLVSDTSKSQVNADGSQNVKSLPDVQFSSVSSIESQNKTPSHRDHENEVSKIILDHSNDASLDKIEDPFAILIKEVNRELENSYSYGRKINSFESQSHKVALSFCNELNSTKFDLNHLQYYDKTHYEEDEDREEEEVEQFMCDSPVTSDAPEPRELSPFSERLLKANNENPFETEDNEPYDHEEFHFTKKHPPWQIRDTSPTKHTPSPTIFNDIKPFSCRPALKSPLLTGQELVHSQSMKLIPQSNFMAQTTQNVELEVQSHENFDASRSLKENYLTTFGLQCQKRKSVNSFSFNDNNKSLDSPVLPSFCEIALNLPRNISSFEKNSHSAPTTETHNSTVCFKPTEIHSEFTNHSCSPGRRNYLPHVEPGQEKLVSLSEVSPMITSIKSCKSIEPDGETLETSLIDQHENNEINIVRKSFENSQELCTDIHLSEEIVQNLEQVPSVSNDAKTDKNTEDENKCTVDTSNIKLYDNSEKVDVESSEIDLNKVIEKTVDHNESTSSAAVQLDIGLDLSYEVTNRAGSSDDTVFIEDTAVTEPNEFSTKALDKGTVHLDTQEASKKIEDLSSSASSRLKDSRCRIVRSPFVRHWSPAYRSSPDKGPIEEDVMLTSSILDWPYLEEEVITQDDQDRSDTGELKIKLPWSRIFDLEKDESASVEDQKSLDLGPVEIKLQLNAFETSCLKVRRLILQKAHTDTDKEHEEIRANPGLVALTREDLLEEMVECKVLSVKLKELVPCDFCGRKLLSQEFLSRHMRHMHELHTCPVCEQTFPGQLLLASHSSCVKERHHCLLCNQVFTTLENFRQHEESSSHQQLESVQRQTIHILYKFLSGRDCTTLEPLTPEEIAKLKWNPSEGDDTVHYYHPTPLHQVLQGNIEIESNPCSCEDQCEGKCSQPS